MPSGDGGGDAALGAHTRRGVRRTFDRIAGHFSQTREYAWPEVEAFLDGRTAGTALDLGCGNGRHAELLADRADRTLGLDASRELLGEAVARAREREFEIYTLQGDAARLPLQQGSVDLAVYVATLHHLPSAAARRASLDELARVLAPGAPALVSAWSTAHDRFDDVPDGEGLDTTVDWTLPGGETVPRFYHVYDPEEFRAELAASTLELADFEVSSGNCYAVVSA